MTVKEWPWNTFVEENILKPGNTSASSLILLSIMALRLLLKLGAKIPFDPWLGSGADKALEVSMKGEEEIQNLMKESERGEGEGEKIFGSANLMNIIKKCGNPMALEAFLYSFCLLCFESKRCPKFFVRSLHAALLSISQSLKSFRVCFVHFF